LSLLLLALNELSMRRVFGYVGTETGLIVGGGGVLMGPLGKQNWLSEGWVWYAAPPGGGGGWSGGCSTCSPSFLDRRLVVISLGPLFVIAAVPSVLLWVAVARHRRLRPGFCTRCGYDLTGNTSGVCPECGTPLLP